MNRKRIETMACGVMLLALLAPWCGCQRDQIRAYRAPKDPQALLRSGQGTTPPAPVETLSWTLPDGWREIPGEGMRYATLLTGDGEHPVEIRVTPLASMARDPLPNLNRWRGQIGLPPIQAAELDDHMRVLENDGTRAELFNVSGPAAGDQPAQQILAAIIPGAQRVWFLVVMDTAERAGPLVQPFEAFVRTVRLESSMPAGHPPVAAAPAAPAPGAAAVSSAAAAAPAPPIRWDDPPGWQRQESTNQFRVVGYTIASGGETASATITRFPGDVGGLLANVNRWRGQLGLAPVAAVTEQPMQQVRIAGESASLLDLTGPGGGAPQRMLVALLAHADATWFFKLTGPPAVVEQQNDAFMALIGSVRFTGGGSD